jgi:Uma2 family endonuclease
MLTRLKTADYLAGDESLARRELIWGVVREPPAPRWGHQSLVTRVVVLLDQFVRAHNLGRVCVSPIDVVLDKRKALVVQPDVVFVSNERAGIVEHLIWGAPDLVVEVESLGTRTRDRRSKLRWYRQYGVREYWLIDPRGGVLTVIDMNGAARVHRRRFRGAQPVHSELFSGLDLRASALFE